MLEHYKTNKTQTIIHNTHTSSKEHDLNTYSTDGNEVGWGRLECLSTTRQIKHRRTRKTQKTHRHGHAPMHKRAPVRKEAGVELLLCSHNSGTWRSPSDALPPAQPNHKGVFTLNLQTQIRTTNLALSK